MSSSTSRYSAYSRSVASSYTPGLRPLPEVNRAPKYCNPVRRPRHYADSLIASQETALAQLRYVRQQLEKEDREMKNIQDNINEWRYPRKWTPYNYMDPKYSQPTAYDE